MIPGYSYKRPKAENYGSVISRMARKINAVDKGISFMVYGSYARVDYSPGRSDLDAVIIFPHDVVIDKKCMHETALAIDGALAGNNMRDLLQLSPLDRTVIKGKFSSFNSDFVKYFKDEGHILTGPDYRDEMNFPEKITGNESSRAHNLRKIRQARLFSEYDKREDYQRFLKGFNATLNAVSSDSKEILNMIDNKFRAKRFSALDELENFFPNIDTEPLKRIKELYSDTDKLDELYNNPNEIIRIWDSSMTFLEEVIREYLNKYPC